MNTGCRFDHISEPTGRRVPRREASEASMVYSMHELLLLSIPRIRAGVLSLRNVLHVFGTIYHNFSSLLWNCDRAYPQAQGVLS